MLPFAPQIHAVYPRPTVWNPSGEVWIPSTRLRQEHLHPPPDLSSVCSREEPNRKLRDFQSHCSPMEVPLTLFSIVQRFASIGIPSLSFPGFFILTCVVVFLDFLVFRFRRRFALRLLSISLEMRGPPPILSSCLCYFFGSAPM